MLAFLLFTALLIAIYGMLHKIWNKRRDERDALEPGMYYRISYTNGIRTDSVLDTGMSQHIENEEFIDITDFELKSFRYPV